MDIDHNLRAVFALQCENIAFAARFDTTIYPINRILDNAKKRLGGRKELYFVHNATLSYSI